MTYPEAIDFLFGSLPVFEKQGAGAYKPGLEQVARFAERLGNPHTKFRAIHVAGTNGKGSVSHMLASTLMSAGYRTGLYTSPHLLDFRERIRLDGVPVGEDCVAGFTGRYGPEMAAGGLTFFEMATLMAFDYFAGEEVDTAVIETGLGGRLDATNIIVPELSVITNIGLEHTKYLGDTVPVIAAEKAGIIKRGIPVVIGESDPQSAPVFRRRAAELASPIVFADAEYSIAARETSGGSVFYDIVAMDGSAGRFETDLGGVYQGSNLLTAIAAAEVLSRGGGFRISAAALHEGLRGAAAATGLSGRWQVVCEKPFTVCDTAHNAHGLARTVGQATELSAGGKLIMVLGFADDKDMAPIIALLPRRAEYILTQATVGRAAGADALLRLFSEAGLSARVVVPVAEAVRTAFEAASGDDKIYIGGSTFVVAEALPEIGSITGRLITI